MRRNLALPGSTCVSGTSRRSVGIHPAEIVASIALIAVVGVFLSRCSRFRTDWLQARSDVTVRFPFALPSHTVVKVQTIPKHSRNFPN
jgi:hypothetical protein